MKPKAPIHAIVLAWGWRRWLIAFAAGALSALAMAPFDAWPILFLTFPTLVWLIDGAAVGRWGGVMVAAATGWWFGFGYFVAGLYWIGYAFLVDAPTFGWMLPFAVIGLPAVLAIYTGFGVALARILWTRGAPRILALGATLTATEWLRGHLFTGFPWNAFGYALTSPLATGAERVSHRHLGLDIYRHCGRRRAPQPSPTTAAETRRPWLPLVLSLAVLAGLGGWGALRLQRTPTRLVDKVHLRIMQPNLQQDVRFNYAARQQVMDRYIALSNRASRPAFARRTRRDAFDLAGIAVSVHPHARARRAGADRQALVAEHRADNRRDAASRTFQSGRSARLQFDCTSSTTTAPFSRSTTRSISFRSANICHSSTCSNVLDCKELTKQQGGFLAGDRRRLIAIPGAPRALPLICYEIIFPGELAPPGERAGWMVNVTNDGWFGISTGPYQHFQQARVSAIEEGLPLARAANTGISAVVDPVGRILNSLPLGSEGVLDSPLPRPIGAPIYARVGDGPAFIIVAIALLLVVRRRLSADMIKI